MVQERSNPAINFFKSIYQDEFQWSVVKSFGLFFLGIRLAKGFVGVEIMPAIHH